MQRKGRYSNNVGNNESISGSLLCFLRAWIGVRYSRLLWRVVGRLAWNLVVFLECSCLLKLFWGAEWFKLVRVRLRLLLLLLVVSLAQLKVVNFVEQSPDSSSDKVSMLGNGENFLGSCYICLYLHGFWCMLVDSFCMFGM